MIIYTQLFFNHIPIFSSNIFGNTKSYRIDSLNLNTFGRSSCNCMISPFFNLIFKLANK